MEETSLIVHWPFGATILVLAAVMETAKTLIWTKDRAERMRWAWYARKTLPLQPVVLGFAFGFLPGVTQTTSVAGWWAAPLYYGFAGVCSTWAYSLMRGFLKKQGIEITKAPMLSSMPPIPEEGTPVDRPLPKPPKAP